MLEYFLNTMRIYNENWNCSRRNLLACVLVVVVICLHECCFISIYSSDYGHLLEYSNGSCRNIPE